LTALLFGYFQWDNGADPELISASVTAIFCDYPVVFVRGLVDPKNGLQTKIDRAPTIKQIKDALEEKMESIYRERARQRYNPNQLEGSKVTKEEKEQAALKAKAFVKELKERHRAAEAESRSKNPSTLPRHNTHYIRACTQAGIDPNGGLVASPYLRDLVLAKNAELGM
jgi:hypothetical protein